MTTADIEIDDVGNYKQELTPEQFRELYRENKQQIDNTPTLKLNSRYVITKGDAHYKLARERGKLRIVRSAKDDIDKLTLLRMIQALTQRVSQLEADCEVLMKHTQVCADTPYHVEAAQSTVRGC